MTVATKTKPDFSLERGFDGHVCGIDEAGRGPLAGPVVAACVYIPEKVRKQKFIADINDSKQIRATMRDALFNHIQDRCSFGVGIIPPQDIDRLNIHHATLLAMRNAYENMGQTMAAALVDGRFVPEIQCVAQAVKKGDSISVSIAAASIIAKVTRDRIMKELHEEHPEYGWQQNAGYGTPQHLKALTNHGITSHHRQSFSPVKQAI